MMIILMKIKIIIVVVIIIMPKMTMMIKIILIIVIVIVIKINNLFQRGNLSTTILNILKQESELVAIWFRHDMIGMII